MKINIKTLSALVGIPLLLVTLFGLVFVNLKLVEISVAFFLELLCVAGISVIVKLWGYPIGEDKALKDADLKKERDEYFPYADKHIANDFGRFEKWLPILMEQRKKDYVANKLGSRTEHTEKYRLFWFKLFHKQYKDLPDEECAKKKIEYLTMKYQKQADKLPPIRSQDIMELTESKVLADSKNYRRKHKLEYQILTTVFSILSVTLISMIAFDIVNVCWESVFRYVTYVFTIFSTAIMTILTATKTTLTDELDYIHRCRNIIRQYSAYIAEHPEEEKEVENNGNSVCVRLEEHSEEQRGISEQCTSSK